MTALFLVLSLLSSPKKPATPPTPPPPAAPKPAAPPPPVAVKPPPSPLVPQDAPYKFTNLNGLLLNRGDDMPFDGVAIPDEDARTQVLRMLTCEAAQHDGVCKETCKPVPQSSGAMPGAIGAVMGAAAMLAAHRAKAARDAKLAEKKPTP